MLATAVKAIGGTEWPGQVEMADAIAECGLDHISWFCVGTGTGKSLGYLAPALLWLVRHPNKRIVVTTATLALQASWRTTTFRRNCSRVRHTAADRGTRFSKVVPTTYVASAAGWRRRSRRTDPRQRSDREHQIGTAEYAGISPVPSAGLRAWAEEQAGQGTSPTAMTRLHTERAWAQVSIPVRSAWCSAARTVMSVSLRAHDAARAADLVVTTALLAINAMHGGTAIPGAQRRDHRRGA